MAEITTPAIDETTATASTPISSLEEELEVLGPFLAGMGEEENTILGGFFKDQLGNRFAERNDSRSKNIEKAIELHRDALESSTPESNPAEWVRVQNNLGLDYLDPASGDPAEQVELAIECFEKALAACPRETAPQTWAWTRHNLANAYSKRIQGRRAENLEKAIELYNEALEVRTREQDPEDWAATTDDLGSAYADRILGDRAENIEKAIELLQSVLEERTREERPEQWAITCNKLGTAYLLRIRKDRNENLKEALKVLTPVLQVWTRMSHPAGYAETSLNLGNVYYEMKREGRRVHLEDALVHYRNASEAVPREEDPILWAKAMISLGNAWQQRSEGDPTENLDESIRCFESALLAISDPLLRARTQNNLANSLRRRNDLDRARALYHEALQVLTLESVPADHLKTQQILGTMEFHAGLWEPAHQAFSAALAARERLYTAGATTEARQHVLAEAAGIPALDACCLARLGRVEEGVEVLERSRARALREVLARREAALQLASTEHRDEFLTVSRLIDRLEAEARAEGLPGAAPSRGFLAISADLREARQKLARVFEQIRAEVPELIPAEPTFPEIAEAASVAGMPIVYLATVTDGSLALVVPPAATTAHTLWLPDFTSADLDAFLYDTEEQRYLIGMLFDSEWRTLKRSLKAAWSGPGKTLLAPLTRSLAAEGWTRAALIATGTLDLLPLPSMAPPDVLFTTLPSARALAAACRSLRESSGAEPVFLGIGDPQPSDREPLPSAVREVEVSAQLFPEANRRLLVREQATLDAVREELRGATHLHFACHGQFNPAAPLDSALLLSGGKRLTWRFLLDGNLDFSTARVVVLSACQTGIKEYQKVPDEVVGFPTALLQAGVPCVLASLWPVPDLCTGILMEEFYVRHIGKGMVPAEALRDAQHHLRALTKAGLADYCEKAAEADASGKIREEADRYRERDDPFAHPWYWAGFVLYGV